MKKRNRNLLGLGLLLGTAFGYMANTKKGKAVRRDTANKINEWSNEAGTYARDTSRDLSQRTSNLIDRLSAWLDSARSDVQKETREGVHEAKAKLEEAESDFQSGQQKAHRKIERAARKTSTGDL